MKLNKILLASIVLFATMLSSCLKDQEDFFPEASSTRLQATLDKCKEVLTSSPNGWAFDYYPDRDLAMGGYVYTVKFDNSTVTAGFELEPGTFETSYYKLTNDNGPILSFDTYNSLLHYFSTPSSGEYEAKDGDFEFLIMDVQDNVIKLKSNRNGNYAYLHRLDCDMQTYLNQVAAFSENLFLENMVANMGGQEVEVYSEPNRGQRYMAVIWGEGDDDYCETVFVPTPTGVRFMKPLSYNGVSVDAMDYLVTSFCYSGVSSKGETVVFQGDAPADYSKYEDFAGEFTLKYSTNGKKTIDINIIADGDNKYTIKGFSDKFDVKATYNEARGYLQINAQEVAVDGNDHYVMCGVGANADGKTTPYWDSECGFFVKKDVKNEGAYLFTPNTFNQTKAHSLMIWRFVGSVDDAGYAAGSQAKKPWYFTVPKSAQLANLHSIVKK
ncbi:MAG: DUF4302 domain-containing protein [Muribaculum sp.]|nr:DUF4302 domain-containing protein [Muribaculaceae bacterium]MCM1081107.1 DUF4302 domain-containing protein [Muribaculum sp.]